MARTTLSLLCILPLLYCNNVYALKGQKNLSDILKDEEAGIIAPKQNILPFKQQKKERIRPAIIDNGKIIPNKSHPQIAKLYEGLGQKISELNFDEEGEEFEQKKNGIDLALKELAAEFEKQFLTIMWQFAYKGANTGHSIGDEIMNTERNNMIVEDSYGGLGEMGQELYEELKRNIFKGEKKNGTGKREQISRGFAKNLPIIHAKS